MADLHEHVGPMVKALRSGAPLAIADRCRFALWLEAMCSELGHLGRLVSGLEAKVVTQVRLDELELWVQKTKMDYELTQMGFEADPPPPPGWLQVDDLADGERWRGGWR